MVSEVGSVHMVPLSRGRWATFDFSHDPKKRFLLWIFDTPNSTYQLAASEATEAGLERPKTSAFMSGGCMQSLNPIALKLRPCIEDRANFWLTDVFMWFGKYKIRFRFSNKLHFDFRRFSYHFRLSSYKDIWNNYSPRANIFLIFLSLLSFHTIIIFRGL